MSLEEEQARQRSAAGGGQSTSAPIQEVMDVQMTDEDKLMAQAVAMSMEGGDVKMTDADNGNELINISNKED